MAKKPKKILRVKGLDGTWIIEETNNRMKTVCKDCRGLPAKVRVVHKTNPDPFPRSTVYCGFCAQSAVQHCLTDAIERMTSAEQTIKNHPSISGMVL